MKVLSIKPKILQSHHVIEIPQIKRIIAKNIPIDSIKSTLKPSRKPKLYKVNNPADIKNIAIKAYKHTPKKLNTKTFIEFKPAKNINEAKEFMKKNFNIILDTGEDLEIANWVAEGITNINNRFKGHVKMPNHISTEGAAIEYFKKEPISLAVYVPHLNDIWINKVSINNYEQKFKNFIESLKNKKNRNASVQSKNFIESLKNKKNRNASVQIEILNQEEIKTLINNILKDKNFTTKPTKIEAYHVMRIVEKLTELAVSAFDERNIIETISKNKRFRKIFKDNGIDIKEVENYIFLLKKQIKTNPDAKQKLNEITAKIKKINNENNLNLFNDKKIINLDIEHTPFTIIYHEMGHLQDKAFNRTLWKTKNLYDIDFKLKYNNIAGKVSYYARTNRGEFIAETFAALCEGRKLPDDVMKLYKLVRGPIVPDINFVC